MQFKSEDDAKYYAVKLTTRHYTLEEAQERLNHYKQCAQNAIDQQEREFWQKEIDGLESWINSDTLKDGAYSQSIDELLFNLIEWRATVYAFQYADTNNNLFTKYYYHSQWLMGAVYGMFSIIGKLTRGKAGDNTLRNLWDGVSLYVQNAGLCGTGEVDFINDKMNYSTGHFTNKNSKAIFYRNKLIAHNARTPKIAWDDMDLDIRLLCRSWALITMWSAIGTLYRFRDGKVAFSGLENIFDQEELKSLFEKREEYLSKVKFWCRSSLCDDKIISERSPFAQICMNAEVDFIKNE